LFFSHWFLAKPGETTASHGGLQWATSTDGKTPDSFGWRSDLPASGLITASGKEKATYLIRIGPTATTAASTAWRVRPAGSGKAPNYKIRDIKDPEDSKKKLKAVAFKKGDQYYVGTATSIAFGVALDDKSTVTVAELLKGQESATLFIRKAATGKRPASETQRIALTAPAAATGGGG
jgi:hypothetical protein